MDSLDGIRNLRDLSLADSMEVGAKAAMLGVLMAAGVRVPPGLVVPAALIGTADEESLADMIVGQVERAGLRPPYAVRSSSASEDRQAASYAGQFRSELSVAPANLSAAVLRCARSAQTANVEAYEAAMGLTRSDALISVIVQEQVDAALAGVLFTADPMSGDTETFVVEMVTGLGDRLVSGEVEPAQLRIGPVDLDVANAPDWWNASLELRTFQVATELRRIGSTLAALLGEPQDIEFCVTADDAVIVVQSRPITTVAAAVEIEEFFRVACVPVLHRTLDSIPLVARELDKVKLRLIADEHDLPVGRAWLLSVVKLVGASRHEFELPEEILEADQVSFVLQDPPKLNGNIVRRFTSRPSRIELLEAVLQRIGRGFDEFTLIGTEILKAGLSGMARRVGNRVVVEAGFGSFVPKGVVVTSQYVCDEAGGILESDLNVQPVQVVIEAGESRVVEINRTPELSTGQLEAVCRSVAAAAGHYSTPSVEFGITDGGSFFLIDLVDESLNGDTQIPANFRVISPGQRRGVTMRIANDPALLSDSLDAHFHSDRPASTRGGQESASATIVTSTLPYLSLETMIREKPAMSLGFVFRSCSYLSHLSIVLRELGIPAVVNRDVHDQALDGQRIEIDAAREPNAWMIEDQD